MKLTCSPPKNHREPLNLPGLHEILLEHRDLARMGGLNTDELTHALKTTRAQGLRTVLVWDVLATDEEIANGASLLRSMDLSAVDSVRVQDPGIAMYIRDYLPEMKIQLVLETGNHNLAGIRAWIEGFRPNIERVVLTNELPLHMVQEMRSAIDVSVEILALGRVLIFYSPRKLVSPITPESDEYDFIQRYATDTESRRHYPLVENRHGTFMFYEKDLFLLPYLDQIEQAGVDFARLELKYYDAGLLGPLADYLAGECGPDGVKRFLAPKLTRGFFKSNRTDKQFVKLKNVKLELDNVVAVVLEAKKDKYLAIMAESTISVGDQFAVVIPEGKRMTHEIKWISDAAGNRVQTASEPGLWLINHGPRLSPGSKLYRERNG